MTEPKPVEPAPDEFPKHFEIHASVVFQLGESLITDSVQALTELVKNSYDADASYCKVSIVTTRKPDQPYQSTNGFITIEDDGTGMSSADIKRGWLTISNSSKRDFKKLRRITGKGRTPLGDKGLGRLGTQRLGHNLEMLTRTADSHVAHHVWFSWKDFLGEHKLSEININYETLASPPFRKGTRLVISDLREIGLWQGNAVKELETSLSQMMFPYGEVRDFNIIADVDGQPLELVQISEKLRQTAQLHYSIKFDQGLFEVTGRAKLSYIRPDNNPDRARFIELVDRDNGQQFFDFLSKQKKAGGINLAKSQDAEWFVEFKRAREFEDFEQLAKVDGIAANPGPFKGEIDFFSLGQDSGSEQSAFDTLAEYRSVISALSGIKVYRDGFGIRVSQDWLNLGKQWTKGSSYYSLKPQNTLGYIGLTASLNSQLEETTDREGFKDSPYYRNFFEMLTSFVGFSGEAQGLLRRGWIQFRNKQAEKEADVAEESTPEALAEVINEELSRAEELRARVNSARGELSARVEASRLAFKQYAGDAALASRIGELQEAAGNAEKLIGEVSAYLTSVEKLSATAKVLKNQIEALRQQIADVHEVVALGLTAEALSHEISNVATQLGQRTQQIQKYFKSITPRDSRAISYTEHVNSAVAELRRQLLFLAPSLRYVRDRRDKIDMAEFVKDLFKHYTQHFAAKPISIDIKQPNARNFIVNISRGKLIQILDNLFVNSEYWLLEDIRMNRITSGKIIIEIDKPYLRIYDTGRGIDPAIESSIFEPFVTAKGKGRGRGLGLYIVTQLLAAENCTMELLPTQNKYGRRYVFELNLTGVLSDK
jgi:signal transduction histidine kinase